MKCYQKLYAKHIQTNSTIELFDNDINKFNTIKQITCDGLLNEQGCKIALKQWIITRTQAQIKWQQSFIKYFGMALRGFKMTL